MNKTRNISITLIVLFLSISLQNHAQDSEKLKVIDSLSLKMFTDMNNKDYDAIIDMTHPKVFEMVPKEAMVTVFKSIIEGNEDFSVEIPEQIPDYKVSKIFTDDDGKTDYAFVSYDMKMTMTFHKEEYNDEMKETMTKMMKLQGMEVEFTSNNSMKVNMPNRMTILINDDTTNNKWAMINYDPNSPLFFQLLSAPVLEKAKEYYQDLMIENKNKN